MNLNGGHSDGLARLGDNSGVLGFAIVALFLVSWAGSTLIYKYGVTTN